MLQQQTECDYELLFNSRIYHVVQLCFFFSKFYSTSSSLQYEYQYYSELRIQRITINESVGIKNIMNEKAV